MLSPRIPPPIRPTMGELRLPSWTSVQVREGMEAIFCPDSTSPLVHLSLALPVGADQEPEAQAGIAALTASVALAGSRHHGLEDRGARFWSEPGWDSVRLCAEAPAALAQPSLTRLLAAALQPTFQATALAHQKRVAMAQRRGGAGALYRVAEEGIATALYGGERYGAPLEGTRRHLERLTLAALRRFHKERFLQSGFRLVAVGRLDPDRLLTRLEALVSSICLGPGSATRGGRAPRRLAPASRLVTVESEGGHAEIRLGRVAVPLHHPDFLPWQILNGVLGGGFASRLALRLRESGGLAYSASSRLEARRGSSLWILRTAVAPDAAGVAMEWILEEMDRLRRRPASAREVLAVKGFLTGALHSGLLSSREIARWLQHLAAHDLLTTYSQRYSEQIRRIGRQRLHALARKVLDPEGWAWLVAGPSEALHQIKIQGRSVFFGGSHPGSQSTMEGGERHEKYVRIERWQGRVGRAGA